MPVCSRLKTSIDQIVQAQVQKYFQTANQTNVIQRFEPLPKCVESKVNVKNFTSLTKKSDVSCNIRSNNTLNTKVAKVFTPNIQGSIHVHNRFNVLSNIDSCDGSEKHHSNNPVNVVNKNKYTDTTSKNDFGAQIQNKDMDDNNVKGKSKCIQKVYGKNVKRSMNNTVILIESDEKYDLELRFKPRHRQRIGKAKNNSTFQLWDNQTKDKYGYISLGDLMIPERNDKNKSISNIKVLHETIKKSKNFNFMQAQVQVPSQLNKGKRVHLGKGFIERT